LFVSCAHLEFPSKLSYLWGHLAVSELRPDVLSGGGRCLFCCARLLAIVADRKQLRAVCGS
jgi:predicted metal-binding protein